MMLACLSIATVIAGYAAVLVFAGENAAQDVGWLFALLVVAVWVHFTRKIERSHRARPPRT